MGAPVVHWEIISPDAEQLQNFYSELFDWHIDRNNPMQYGLVDTHGEGGINGGIGKPPEGSGHLTFYVQVDDLQKSLDRAEQLGGKTVMPPDEVPGTGVASAMFTDPSGNLIGVT